VGWWLGSVYIESADEVVRAVMAEEYVSTVPLLTLWWNSRASLSICQNWMHIGFMAWRTGGIGTTRPAL
jgi:hypothetical protein